MSTLLSLILITGLTLTLQAQSLASTKAAKRIASLQEEALGGDAVRALMRPLIGAAMLGEEAVPLDGSGYGVRFDGRGYEVLLEVVKPVGWTVGSGVPVKEVEVRVR